MTKTQCIEILSHCWEGEVVTYPIIPDFNTQKGSVVAFAVIMYCRMTESKEEVEKEMCVFVSKESC